ncbi:MAG: pro-sigmaK processing inhibitor BofA family protein [Acutalibacteraceae bacterium]
MFFECKTIVGLCLCFLIIILIVMLRSKHFFRCLLLSAFTGVASLFAVNLLSAVTGFSLAINPVTIGISSVGGVPAVIMLLFSRLCLI